MDEMCPPLHAAVVPCPKSFCQHGGFEITLHQNGGAGNSVSSQKVQVEICAHHFKMTWFAIAHRRHLKPHIVKTFTPSGTNQVSQEICD